MTVLSLKVTPMEPVLPVRRTLPKRTGLPACAITALPASTTVASPVTVLTYPIASCAHACVVNANKKIHAQPNRAMTPPFPYRGVDLRSHSPPCPTSCDQGNLG